MTVHPFWWRDGQPSVAPPSCPRTFVPLRAAGSTAVPKREIGGARVHIGLLTEGGYPYASGDARLWCDRLVRGVGQHKFDIYAISRSEYQEAEGWIQLPPQVSCVRTAPFWSAQGGSVVHGRRARRRFAEVYGELVAAVCGAGGTGAAGIGGETRGPMRRGMPPTLRRTVSAARSTGSPNSLATRVDWSAPCARKPPYAQPFPSKPSSAPQDRAPFRVSRAASPP